MSNIFNMLESSEILEGLEILTRSHQKEKGLREIQRIVQGNPDLPKEKLTAYIHNLEDSLIVNQNAQEYLEALTNLSDQSVQELANLKSWYDETYALLIQFQDLLDELEELDPDLLEGLEQLDQPIRDKISDERKIPGFTFIDSEKLSLREHRIISFFNQKQVYIFSNLFPPKFESTPPNLFQVVKWMHEETLDKVDMLDCDFNQLWDYIDDKPKTGYRQFMLTVSNIYQHYEDISEWADLMPNIKSHESPYQPKLATLLCEISGLWIDDGIETCRSLLHELTHKYHPDQEAFTIAVNFKSRILSLTTRYSEKQVIDNYWWKLSHLDQDVLMNKSSENGSIEDYLKFMKF